MDNGNRSKSGEYATSEGGHYGPACRDFPPVGEPNRRRNNWNFPLPYSIGNMNGNQRGNEKNILLQLENNGSRKCASMRRDKIWFESYTEPLKPGSIRRWITDAVKEDKSPEMRCYDFKKVKKHVSSRSFGLATEDQRLFIQWQDLFLVKKWFTFGVCTVKPGSCHKVSSFEKQMDLYVLVHPGLYEEGVIPESMDYFEENHIQPRRERLLKPGTTYILIAPTKCMFKLETE